MSHDLYAEPMVIDADWALDDRSKFYWYHSFNLPKSGLITGDWDLIDRFDDYVGNVNVGGKRLLDIGTASGFISFEAEQRGAEVVSVDLRDAGDLHRLPFSNDRSMAYDDWLKRENNTIKRMKRSYWVAHNEFNSNAKVYYGPANHLPDKLGMFDVVILGQILVHNPDGMRIIESAARRCSDKLIIVEGMQDTSIPMGVFIGKASVPERVQVFWHYSVGFFVEFGKVMGFEKVTHHKKSYKCNNFFKSSQSVDVTTIVLERKRW